MTAEDQTPAPPDPAGTRRRHDPASLLPTTREPLVMPDAEVVDSTAEDEGDEELLPERRRAAMLGSVEPARHSVYAPRFQFLSGALVAVGIAAIVGIVAFVVVPSTRTPAPPWSPWKPSSSGVQGASQIADHVAPEYKQAGEQLVHVNAQDLSVNGIPLTVEVRAPSAQGGQIEMHGEKGLIYQLCGLGGQHCAIPDGKVSTRRELLLRREALELALYSFRYLKDVKQVVVMVPPRKGDEQTRALYFRAGDVAPQLTQPLRLSLAPTAPTVDNVRSWPDAALVDRATRASYLFSLDGSSITGTGLLVLQPYSSKADKELQTQMKRLQQQQQQQTAAVGG